MTPKFSATSTPRPFGERLRAHREASNLSQEELAARIGVSRATLARWENGSARPGSSSVPLLEKAGAPVPQAHETNALSIPRIKAATGSGSERAEDLRQGSERPFRMGREVLRCIPAPYVRNGPPDQTDFHTLLISMQEKVGADTAPDFDKSRLALIEEIDGVTPAQHRLEKRRPTAVSWNSNYGPHGWHRYVGRFPPHLVRALLNSWNIGAGDVALDPFAGSGTTLVEARLLGIPAVGVEVCPLSAMISRVKSQFPVVGSRLADLPINLVEACSGRPCPDGCNEVFAEYPRLTPFPNAEKWFTPSALAGVGAVVDFAAGLTGYEREFVLTALSAKMRSIGNVDVDVVRAEYRHEPRENVDVTGLVAGQLRKMLRDISDTIKTHEGLVAQDPSTVSLLHESVLTADITPGSVSAIITSPPYGVESLSYLRTHLLSYRTLHHFLGADPYERQEDVIGSEYLDGGEIDPEASLVWGASPSYRGFFGVRAAAKDARRSAMMAKFFDDMLAVGRRCRTWLRDGGRMAFVVGNKRLGDRIIPTHEIVSEIFSECGLAEEQAIAHKLKTNNSNSQVPWQERIIQNEYVLVFRAV